MPPPVTAPRPRLAPCPRPTRPTRRSPAVAAVPDRGTSPPRAAPAFGCGRPAPPPPRALRTKPAPDPPPPIARVLAVLDTDAPSPVAAGRAAWSDVLSHEATRLTWFESGLALTVFVAAGASPAAFDAAVAGVDAVIVVDAPDDSAAAALVARPSVSTIPTLAPLGACGPAFSALARVAGAAAHPTSLIGRLAASLPFSRTAAAARALTVAAAMWARGHGDDVLSAVLVIVDAGVVKLKSVDAFRGQGAATLLCMLRHCREATLACVTDPDCKAGLDCLSAVPPGDQVAAYRCIVSHESAKFEAFSLCVLTRHRCLGVDAAIPALPTPDPQPEWRGAPLDAKAGLQIFVGWLAESDPVSWRVHAGLSPAFDQFPDQLQLFYHGAARGSFWYDPVFRVETLAGALVWRRRHYRVRAAPGGATALYYFSVLDNGVVSSEVWRIVDCPDDMSYALFCYVGAAAASGQAYVGAVLCTRDGGPPPDKHADRLAASLRRASIEEWELIQVRADPQATDTAPLGLDRRDAAADPINGGGGLAVP